MHLEEEPGVRGPAGVGVFPYVLTGDVSEQLVTILWGPGGEGKSTFAATVQRLLGEYARQAAPDLLVVQHHEPHPTGVADLVGARLAVASEIEAGQQLAEARVKQLTGGDRVKARHMRQDFFEFDARVKLWLLCNSLPLVRGTDRGIWRRLVVIPCRRLVPEAERDPHLAQRLAAELAGILN
jgi:putative DNA primase/helicase